MKALKNPCRDGCVLFNDHRSNRDCRGKCRAHKRYMAEVHEDWVPINLNPGKARMPGGGTISAVPGLVV